MVPIWKRDRAEVSLDEFAGRPVVRVAVNGRSVQLPISDAVDVAHAIDRAVTKFVEIDRAKSAGRPTS